MNEVSASSGSTRTPMPSYRKQNKEGSFKSLVVAQHCGRLLMSFAGALQVNNAPALAPSVAAKSLR